MRCVIIITRTAHSEALVVSGAGCEVDHLDQPRGGSVVTIGYRPAPGASTRNALCREKC
jgi:hypothetical protein